MKLPDMEKLIYLRSFHKDVSNLPVTHDRVHDFYQALMTEMFRFVGSDARKYPTCFKECIKACKTTKISKAVSWSSWYEFPRLVGTMEKNERHIRYTELLHIPCASTLLMAFAMRDVILHDKIKENDKVCRFLEDFHCLHYAATAIYSFEKGCRQEILTLDQPWRLNSTFQRKPDWVFEQSTEQQGPAPRNEATTSSNSDRVEEHPLPNPEPSGAQSGGGESSRGQMPLPAAPEPTSTLVRDVHNQVTRAEAMELVRPFLDQLQMGNDNAAIQRRLGEVLTEEIVRVLPAAAKNILSAWASKLNNTTLLDWLWRAREDVLVFEWTVRYTEPTPDDWRSYHSAHAAFYEMDLWIDRVSEASIRRPLRAHMERLRNIFDHRERAHKEETLNRMETMQREIASEMTRLSDLLATPRPAEEPPAGPSEGADDDGAGEAERETARQRKKRKKGKKRAYDEMAEE